MCSETTGGLLDFCSIYGFFEGEPPEWLASALPDALILALPDWLAFVLASVTIAFIVINSMVMATAAYTWFERRGIGRFQNRLGPNRWGPFGLLQPIADILKLISKEDTIPEAADRPAFTLAPVVFVAPALLVFAIIPLGDNSFLGRLNVGVLFIVGVTSVNTIGVLMAGWGSRNKYAMFGTMRGVAMLISYEVPMALALTGVVLVAGSLALSEIVISQDLPFVLVQPLGFLVFMAAASAEMSRTPFDMIEAESELGGGYNTEFSGIKFALFQLAEFMAPLVTATIATALFLGGTRGFDPVPGPVWFAIKVVAIVSILLWVRSTWPRLRVSQIMGFAWKGLFPLALANIFLVAVEVAVFLEPGTESGPLLSTGDLWIMAAINWTVMFASIAIVANLLGQRRIQRRQPVPSPLANMYAEAD